MNGQAVALRILGDNAWSTVLSPITSAGIDRESALSIAQQTVRRDDWSGPRQILFIHSDGYLELWDKELRE